MTHSSQHTACACTTHPDAPGAPANRTGLNANPLPLSPPLAVALFPCLLKALCITLLKHRRNPLQWSCPEDYLAEHAVQLSQDFPDLSPDLSGVRACPRASACVRACVCACVRACVRARPHVPS